LTQPLDEIEPQDMPYDDIPIVVINSIGTLRRLTVLFLKKIGYQTILDFSNLDSALHHLIKHPGLQVVLLEMSNTESIIPELNFLIYLDKHKDLKQVKVIASSAKVTQNTVVLFLKLGLKKFILKNENANHYHEAIQKTLRELLSTESLSNE